MGHEIIRRHLDQLLAAREPPKTICPSEAARALSASELEDLGMSHWRDAMPAVREILWAMRDAGQVDILQKGEVLSPDKTPESIKGPIRARRR